MKPSVSLVLFFTLWLTCLETDVKAQTTLIPDPRFEQALINLNLDIAPVNGSVPTINISSIRSLNVNGNDINSLTGIQDFISLTDLFCNNNNISILSVTNNTALRILECDRNQITTLDVRQNTALITLIVSNNQLTGINTSQNTALLNFGCSNNMITRLDISKNTLLENFVCANNRLSDLDVSKNTALLLLDCLNNRITTLDVSKNTALINLGCEFNQLTSLDVTKNMVLKYLLCFNNQLTSLNIKNGFNPTLIFMRADNNFNLSCIQVDDAVLASGYIDWYKDATARYNDFCIPSITSFTPASGCTGQVVTITGSNLNVTTAVNFGGIAAASFTILTSNIITAVVGTGATGNIQVISPGGTASVPGFIFNPVQIPASVVISSTAGIICPGENVIFTGTPVNGGTVPAYQWQVNGLPVGTNASTYATNTLANGDRVNVTMTSGLTCVSNSPAISNTITMIVNPFPVITCNPANPTIPAGASVQLNATVSEPIVSQLWTPPTGLNDPLLLDPVAAPAITTTYNLRVVSAGNCVANKELTVTVFKDIYIPNSFTPNGDGINDIFRIPPGTTFTLSAFLVYDRYGKEIFNSADISKGWDGNYKGKRVQAGAYTYLIKGKGLNAAILLKGTVLVIR